jgi:hypothetical protein
MTRIQAALDIAYRYGQIDGHHHKAWVIDQMVRALLDEDAYTQWVLEYEGEDYDWDTGIAP